MKNQTPRCSSKSSECKKPSMTGASIPAAAPILRLEQHKHRPLPTVALHCSKKKRALPNIRTPIMGRMQDGVRATSTNAILGPPRSPALAYEIECIPRATRDPAGSNTIPTMTRPKHQCPTLSQKRSSRTPQSVALPLFRATVASHQIGSLQVHPADARKPFKKKEAKPYRVAPHALRREARPKPAARPKIHQSSRSSSVNSRTSRPHQTSDRPSSAHSHSHRRMEIHHKAG